MDYTLSSSLKTSLICNDKYIKQIVSSKNFSNLEIKSITNINLTEPIKTQLKVPIKFDDTNPDGGIIYRTINMVESDTENIFFAATKKEYRMVYKHYGILICLKEAVDKNLIYGERTIIVTSYEEALAAIYCLYFYYNSTYIIPYALGNEDYSFSNFIAEIIKMKIIGNVEHRTIFWIYKNPESPDDLFLTYFFISARENISELTEYELYKYAVKESDHYITENYNEIPETNMIRFWLATTELNNILNDNKTIN